MKSSSSILYIGTQAEVEHHAAPLAEHLPVKILEGEEVSKIAQPGDLAIFFNEYFTRFRHVVKDLKERNCGTLYAVDGILEWRNSWEFPDDVAVPWVMRPILSHKVACIGRSQARILESWGNLGKCEVVGVPRFDRLLQRLPRVRKRGEPFTILIITAKTPGFTTEQVERTRQSLAGVKTWFDNHPMVGDIPLCPRWRVTAGLAEDIGVVNNLQDTTGNDLASALEQVDAVITTPSTSMLEAMLQGLPVVLLDYHNCPHYVPAAWTITSHCQIDQVLSELVSPSPARMLHQQTLLHDALECHSPATPRFVALVQRMLQIAQHCLEDGKRLEFPCHILEDGQLRHHFPENCFDMQKLFPQHPFFSNWDLTELQTQVGDGLLELKKMRHKYELLQNEHMALQERKDQLGRDLRNQIQEYEASLSFRIGRAITWPLRALAEKMR